VSATSPNPPNRRRKVRYALALPVDITVLRSGVPDAIPGRTLDLGEGGLAAILAGELRAGDSVGIEIKLQGTPEPLLAMAIVRHQHELRCGLEFQHLSLDQRELIRDLSLRGVPLRNTEPARVRIAEPAATVPANARPVTPLIRFRRWLGITAAAIFLVAAVAGWHWYRGWQELESHIDQQPVSETSVAQVPPSEVEHLVVHKVDPVYPEDAKRANLQGVVVLATVIGSDGNVERVSPVSGPDVLASAAMEAVRWWRFQPYLVNGKPVPIETMLAVDFRL
jgi:TonB family protein